MAQTVKIQLPPGVSDYHGKDGIRYKSAADGTVTVPLTEAGNLLQLGGQTISTNSATGSRPKSATVGYQHFDTTLNKPIWKGNTGWIDATGTAV